MRCGYCFSNIDEVTKFFSSYIDHIIIHDNEDERLPIFCNEGCMLRWAAIRKRMSLEEIVNDYAAYSEAKA